MTDQRVTINRPLVGGLALLCIAGAVASFFVEAKDVNVWQGILTRVSIVLTALWLALPKDGTLGNWASVSVTTLIALVASIFVVARDPKRFLPILLAVAAIARFLRPKEKTRPPRNV